jgi:hypothetical protein
MTDTAFYDRMDELASRLMNKFGTAATIRTVTKGEADANGDVPKNMADTPGLAVKTSEKSVVDRLIGSFDAVFVFKGPVEPKVDDLLLHATKTWKVGETNVVSPEGTRIFVTILGVGTA